MREIKFRTWDNVKNKMHYVGEETEIVFHFDSSGIIATDITEDEDEFKTLHHLLYMQYSGIKDKNGVGIYEGDVLDYRYVVTYVEGSDNANLGMDVGFYQQRDNFESWVMLVVGEEYEVLGNIYENPDLIKR